MSDRTEFRPIESAPSRRVWPWAIAGAVLVAALVFVARRNTAAAIPEKPVALANVAPKPPELPKTEPAASPNVLGAAVAAAKNVAMVARAEFDREVARTQNAQKQNAA